MIPETNWPISIFVLVKSKTVNHKLKKKKNFYTTFLSDFFVRFYFLSFLNLG